MSSVRKLALALVLATGFMVSGPALGTRSLNAAPATPDPTICEWYTYWTELWGQVICGGPARLCGVCRPA